MSATPIKIAVIGGGLIGPRHAKSIIANPSCTLTALVEPSPHGSQVAASLGVAHYPSIATLLSSPDRPDATIVCTPNSTHVPLAIDLIEAGIHVLVEKPISTSIEDGKRLLDAAKNKGVKVLVGHHRRFNPYISSTKRELESGALGTIIAVQGIWALQKPYSYFEGLGAWRQNAGVVPINLIHEIDCLQYLFGSINLVSALPTKKIRDFEAEEGAAILLRFESGAVGTFVLSDVVPSPWNFEAGTGENPTIPHVSKGHEAGGFYRILGTKGSLSVPDCTRWSYEVGKEGWNEVLKSEKLEVETEQIPFDEQIKHFVKVVRGMEDPGCSGDEGLRAVVVCEAVKRSLTFGKALEIKEFGILEN